MKRELMQPALERQLQKVCLPDGNMSRPLPAVASHWTSHRGVGTQFSVGSAFGAGPVKSGLEWTALGAMRCPVLCKGVLTGGTSHHIGRILLLSSKSQLLSILEGRGYTKAGVDSRRWGLQGSPELCHHSGLVTLQGRGASFGVVWPQFSARLLWPQVVKFLQLRAWGPPAAECLWAQGILYRNLRPTRAGIC